MYSLQALSARGGSASASASFTAEQPNQICVERRHNVHVEPLHPLQLRPLNWQSVRPKQVTDPLNEAVRARLIRSCSCSDDVQPDYSTSGSDHGIESDMRFLEEDQQDVEGCADSLHDNGSDDESPADQLFLEDQLRDILERVCSSVKLEELVLRDVRNALGVTDASNASLSTEEAENHDKSYLRRFVMSKLRNAGYNAGICKSRWEQTSGCPAGDYEMIDVVSDNHRLIVDIDFRVQFEIARPTAEYGRLVEQLPAMFVGDAEKLRDVIRTMCQAAKLSVRAKGMALPPWRKFGYVAAKWLGPYKRSTNVNAVACMDEQKLVVREFSGIAAFKGVRCHWDAAFIHQLELHFEKAVREANRAAPKKRQPQHEQTLLNDLFVSKGKTKSGLNNAVRTSGLAAALAEAAGHMDGDNMH
ncbi:hypothetical protein SUGI_0335530 [Cryptomeria japonica]|uniref:uncharacterized protein LOC131036773 n=1 Tax=Cryptomeria japonica TaxID=3369 RepID=UPI002408E7F4|nr:uncharacterized protein LOC131036773 [Cryptomeria japonica]GLJ18793.1 hypothetical protein SUGI_0335530 [Cryptomeria japonica]